MSGVQDILLEESHAPPLQHVYTNGSGTETIPGPSPITYSTMIIEVWGLSGEGGTGTGIDGSQGGGGASGSYCRSSYTVSSAGGQTIDYAISSTQSSVSSGTFSVTTMTALAGGAGQNATTTSGAGTGGTASGVATGGNVVNSNGNPGQTGSPVSTGAGGTPVTGVYISATGGGRGSWGNTHILGGSAIIAFTYLQ